MAATIQTTNRALAAGIQQANRDATNQWTGTVWEVSHETRLVISMEVAVRAGFSASYADDDWGVAFREMVTEGYIDHHTQRELVVESGDTEDRDYLESTGPTRTESQQTPPQDWRSRLLTYGVI